MIAFVKGSVADISADRVVVDVAGIGYEVLVPQLLLESMKLGQEATLLTYHHVRENGVELFGFAEPEAKRLFELLLGVAGVGPKSALAVMSLGGYEQIRQAIASGNSAYIAGAAGVGKKSAERVITDLKDKVGPLSADFGPAPVADDDALAALMALGYSGQQAAKALAEIDTSLSTEERVKLALKEIV